MEEVCRRPYGARRRAASRDIRIVFAALLGLAVIGLAPMAPAALAKSTGGLALVTETPVSSAVEAGPVSAQADPFTAPVARGIYFGSRVLRQGMSGEDVRVLNGIVKAKRYAKRVKVTEHFHAHTSNAVRRFQSENSLRPNGVVDRRTAKALASSMRRAKSTWYGPGFYGNQTACGQTLRYGTVGVAHRSLPCGTKVTFRHRGRSLVAKVIDRGPFVSGIKWDLTGATARSLGFSGSGPIRYAISR